MTDIKFSVPDDLLKKMEDDTFKKRTHKCNVCSERKSYTMKRQLCDKNINVFDMADNCNSN